MDFLANLTHALERLPGVGRRSGERIAIALAGNIEKLAVPLMEALGDLQEHVCLCRQCGSVTSRDRNPCSICSDSTRDAGMICVVEDPADITPIERSGAFKGRYHALVGKLSPARRTGANEIRLKELFARIADEHVTELILALSTDTEGEATAHYITEQLQHSAVRITRLARGLPADSGVAYSDPLTLKRAIQNRYATHNEN